VIIEHKGDLHPQIIIEDDSGQRAAIHPLPEKAYIDVEDGEKIEAGMLLAKTPREIQGTQDITGGLPRVTELFEARNPKDPAVLAEIEGIVEIGDKKRGKRTIIVRGEGGMEREHLVPQSKNLRVHRGDHVAEGEPLCDGPRVPHDILAIEGEKALQNYLLREIQSVYRAQGVSIDDKHIEIILAQMMRKVQVNDPGDSEFLPGAIVDKFRFRSENAELIRQKKKPATSSALLMGITKASLQSESFISAASFQETTKVLTEAALAGKRDNLVGLKENVILGHLVPTGTGFREYVKTACRRTSTCRRRPRRSVASTSRAASSTPAVRSCASSRKSLPGSRRRKATAAAATRTRAPDPGARRRLGRRRGGFGRVPSCNHPASSLLSFAFPVPEWAGFREPHAHDQPANPQGPQEDPSEEQVARARLLPAEARCLPSGEGHDPQEAELGAAEDRSCPSLERQGSHRVHPR
jgi:hypothetical protein